MKKSDILNGLGWCAALVVAIVVWKFVFPAPAIPRRDAATENLIRKFEDDMRRTTDAAKKLGAMQTDRETLVNQPYRFQGVQSDPAASPAPSTEQ